MTTILVPVLALCVWTFVLWFWMYMTRLPAMRKARIDARKIKRKHELDGLPVGVQQIADNYNHLHEQPTVFYALAFYSHLVGVADSLNIQLAWGYVLLRVIHSLIQCTSNYVPLRFMVFTAGSLVLMAIAMRNVLALFA
ncbi:MAG TPA: MAPEG family protein [Oligoflexus sp.]|uniref:MAPEG family protein n=1 Tax=Oligoflexus sp. TaxID=1971216 RepID=UPI002D7F01AE|nr:MAPEG family protein [Oligoflexus sp.]HET9235743.1 MAPEG family protein [Oligoflexus sp.]